jgi:hypothetical protein
VFLVFSSSSDFAFKIFSHLLQNLLTCFSPKKSSLFFSAKKIFSFFSQQKNFSASSHQKNILLMNLLVIRAHGRKFCVVALIDSVTEI